MRTFKIDTSSWHYRAALWGANGKDWRVPTDFCSYWRNVTGACVMLLMLGAVLSLLLAAVVFIVYNAVALVWYWEATPNRVFSALVVAVVGGVTGIMLLLEAAIRRHNRRKKAGVQKQRSFIGQAYDSWKHKYCMQLEFIKKEDTTEGLK